LNGRTPARPCGAHRPAARRGSLARDAIRQDLGGIIHDRCLSPEPRGPLSAT
jgi:hypothetical protein